MSTPTPAPRAPLPHHAASSAAPPPSGPEPSGPEPSGPEPGGRRTGLLWAGGALAAAILVLGTSGTLSSWTSAVLLNDTDTVKTAAAVILRATDGTSTCTSSDTPTTNSSTCSTINTYGGVTAPLSPGGQRLVDVTFSNVGAAAATSFSLAPGTCSQSPTAGSGSPAAANLCTSGDLTVAVSCSPGATYSAGSAWADLVQAAAAPLTATKTHTAASGDLNAAASWTCRFTVALSASASVLAQDVTVSQPLTWTLTKV